jgi:hypothetical protein
MRRVKRGTRLRLQHGVASAALAVLVACEPVLHVGKWTCTSNADAALANATDPVGVPWSTGFEDQFCDYTQLAGFCYAEPKASYTTVTSPAHSGQFAAAFRVTTGDTTGHQTRCVRQGALPAAAYYGAWYFVPERVTNTGLWNLWHFQGGSPSGPQHGLWDISLVNGSNGDLELVVYDFLNNTTRHSAKATPIPIAGWFHVELFLKRAADATGEVALYQDGQQLLDVTNVITDDSNWGQWYVGNLISGVTPRDSTLYVDDVTIRSTR